MAMGEAVDRAESVARLVELHSEGKISDEELASLRADLLSTSKRRWAVPLVVVGCLAALIGAVSFFALDRDEAGTATSGPTEAVVNSDRSVASTVAPVGTVRDVVVGDPSTPPLVVSIATTLSSQDLEEKRSNLVSSVSARGRGSTRRYSQRMVEGFEVRYGMRWAANGNSSQQVIDCTFDEWSRFTDYERIIREAIGDAETNDPFLQRTFTSDIERRIPDTLKRALDSDSELLLEMIYGCSA